MHAVLFDMRIDANPFLAVVDALALVAAVLLIARRPTRRWLITIAAAGVAGVGFGYLLCWVVGDELDLFGFSLTPITRMWVGFLTGGLALVVVNVVLRQGWPRVVAALCAPVIALACAAGLNVDAGAYATVAEAVGIQTGPGALSAAALPPVDQRASETADGWRAQSFLPTHGQLFSVRIPGTVSGFHARAAEVYLPPAALTRNPPALPVILAFSGQPGSPTDLFDLGHLGSYLNQYAKQHHGLAPIVVSPDQLGAADRNPMCVNSPLGNVATYVTRDVVSWVRAHLNVETGAANWGLLGFSEGATCANQFLEGYPQLFSAELSISSELRPWNGADTITEAFYGSRAAYSAAAPEALMRAHARQLRGDFAEFAVGGDDARFRPNAVALSAAARRAGMAATLTVSPGSAHDWNTVRYALAHDLNPLIDHLFSVAA